jgi:hypothetical protein
MTEKTGSTLGGATAAGGGEGFGAAAAGGVSSGRSDAQLKPPSKANKHASTYGQRNAREKAVIDLPTLLRATSSSSRNAPNFNLEAMSARTWQITNANVQTTKN